MVGLQEIGVYIGRFQNTVAQYISTCPFMDLCLVVEQNLVIRLFRQWWDQPTLDILGIRAEHAAASAGEETGERGRLYYGMMKGRG